MDRLWAILDSVSPQSIVPPSKDLWRPPAPVPPASLRVAWWVATRQRRDLLEVLTDEAYRKPVMAVPIGRRKVFIVSAPELVRRVLVDDYEIHPKSDLMRAALGPLVGEGLLVSNGDAWAHDRQMLEPAFAQLRLEQVFPLMQAAVLEHVEALAARGHGVALDLEQELSHVTADVMLRAIFSVPISSIDAAEVFAAFMRFQRGAPQFELDVVLRSDPAKPEPMPAPVTEDADAVRRLVGRLLEVRRAALARGETFVDLAQAVIDARDAHGSPFPPERLVDQLTVLFLAGHETTASALTWTLFLLSQQRRVLVDLRGEIERTLARRPMTFADARSLQSPRAVFREALRLYPPAGFLTRLVQVDEDLGGSRVPRGSLLVVSPWVVHRHHGHWRDADRFDPARFAEGAPPPQPGTYIPFGMGPRVCTGAAIAQLEAQVILAEYLRRFDFEPIHPEQVMPMSRVTIRPRGGMLCRVLRSDAVARR